MRKTLAFAILSAVGLLVVLLLVLKQRVSDSISGQDPKATAFPDPTTITSMDVRLSSSSALKTAFENRGATKPDTFSVKTEQIPELLRHFRVTAILDDTKDPIVPWIGLATLEMKQGTHDINVSVFQTDKDVGAFTVNVGSTWIKYRGGNDNEFSEALADAFVAGQ